MDSLEKVKNLLVVKEKIRAEALKLGFDVVGFTEAKVDQKYVDAFNAWLKKKYEGCMDYLHKAEQRADLMKILPGAKSVISMATNYYHDQGDLSSDSARVARYAYGRDYHKVIGKRLKKLQIFMKDLCPEAETRGYVDTGPILERALAEQAGVGFIGKNTCLITKELGSWVFLSEIITTLPLPPDKVNKTENDNFGICGSCTLCIDACPTGAIVAPGVIDSRRCIAYLTIEQKEEMPEEFREIIRKTRTLYGCDICQEVCPHNSAAKRSLDEELKGKKIAGDELKIKDIMSLKSDEEFVEKFAGSPMMRAKLKGLKRTAKIFLD